MSANWGSCSVGIISKIKFSMSLDISQTDHGCHGNGQHHVFPKLGFTRLLFRLYRWLWIVCHTCCETAWVRPCVLDTWNPPPRLLSQVSTTKSIVVAKLDPRLPQIHLHSWRGTWRGHQEFTPSSFDASQKLPTILVCQMSCLFLKETKGSSCGLNLSWIRCMCRLFQGTLPGVEGVCGFDLLLYYK